MNTLDRMAYTCCFLGHREIQEFDELKAQLYQAVEDLIVDKQIDTFLFGSKSRFNNLCYEVVTQLKEKHPHIRRLYVRGEFPVIDDGYRAYLLERYEDTYYPPEIIGAGKSVYIQRNQIMIDRSQFCVFYYRDNYTPMGRKSGTKLALDYAIKRSKTIFRLPGNR